MIDQMMPSPPSVKGGLVWCQRHHQLSVGGETGVIGGRIRKRAEKLTLARVNWPFRISMKGVTLTTNPYIPPLRRNI